MFEANRRRMFSTSLLFQASKELWLQKRKKFFFFRIDLKRKEVFFKLIGMVTEVDEESGEERLVHIVGCFE